MVTAFGPVLKTVICPLPLIQYCHSSALGCQCISRRPPGRTVTSAAATVVETVKLRLSAIRTEPPFVSRAGLPIRARTETDAGARRLRSPPRGRGRGRRVAFFHVGDIGSAQFVENGDAHVP